MSQEAIFNVTQALSERLQEAVADIPNSTVFVGPLDDPDAKNAALILFLYRIMPNPSLRNREHRVLSSQPPHDLIVYENSLPLTLHYLITVGTLTATEGDPLLKLLGRVMQTLNEEPELTGMKVGHETVRVSLEPVTTEEMSRVWTLFPTANYRTSIAYLASPVWIDPKREPIVGGRVVEDRLDAGVKLREPTDA